MFDKQNDDKAIEFANEFLKRYTAVGFGALSKREVDLMLLQLLQDHLPNFKNMNDFDAAIMLKTTKRKIRGLRDEISFREGHNQTNLRARLKEVLISAEVLADDMSMVMVQIDDAVLRGLAEKIVRSEFGVVDSSFNSAILKLSGEKYLLLAYSLLNDAERKSVEATIKSISKKQDSGVTNKSTFTQFKDGFVMGVGTHTGKLCVSAALALHTGGTSLILEGAEPAVKTGRGLGEAIKTAREFFIKRAEAIMLCEISVKNSLQKQSEYDYFNFKLSFCDYG